MKYHNKRGRVHSEDAVNPVRAETAIDTSKRFYNGEPFKNLDEALTTITSNEQHTITIDEGERQMILLALAELAQRRPGWHYSLTTIALKMDNRIPDGGAELFEKFYRIAPEVAAEKLSR